MTSLNGVYYIGCHCEIVSSFFNAVLLEQVLSTTFVEKYFIEITLVLLLKALYRVISLKALLC